MLAAIPAFYLNGRWIGGKIAGIGFDGVSRDIYYLFTLKINYQSYLEAPAPSRQWIFLFGGIGTVITSLLISLIAIIIYNDYIFLLVPFFLFFGEILDYLHLAGPLGGGEFHHLRREHRITKEWRLHN